MQRAEGQVLPGRNTLPGYGGNWLSGAGRISGQKRIRTEQGRLLLLLAAGAFFFIRKKTWRRKPFGGISWNELRIIMVQRTKNAKAGRSFPKSKGKKLLGKSGAGGKMKGWYKTQ